MSSRPPARREQFLEVSVRLGRSTILHGTTRVQIMIDVRPVADIVGTTPDLDYRLVVDRSGSMDEQLGRGNTTTRLQAVRPALIKFIKNLSPRDRAMLVTFSERHEVLQDLVLTGPGMVHSLVKKIEGITGYRSTRFTEALRSAMHPGSVRGVPSRLILFTDGNSNVNAVDDHKQMVQLADQARQLGVPWLIYGTGSDYNWELLQQIAVRAGNGSFCKHVMDPAALEGHLIGELAFHRGVTVEGLTIDGQSSMGRIVSVTRFMPTQVDLPDLSTLNRSEPRPRDFFNQGRFHDGTGSLDHFRGQQLLIELDLPSLPVGEHSIMAFTMKGAVIPRGLLRFSETIEATISVTDDQSCVSTVDPEVMRVMRMMAARKAADEERFDRASVLYHKAGDHDTATAMHTLHQQSMEYGADMEDLRRAASTCTGEATSMSMTEMINVRSRGARPRRPMSPTGSKPTDS